VLIAEDTDAPYSFDWVAAPSGGQTVFARAYDSAGGIKDSENVNITIATPPTSIRLQGDIENSAGGYMQGITVRLTGTVNGNPVNQTSISNSFGSYGFFNLTPGGDYIVTPEAANLTFTPPSFTVLNATADNYDIDFIASGVNEPPTVQINSPENGTVVTMPGVVQVNVAAADDSQVVRLTVSAVGPTFSQTIAQSNNGTVNVPWSPNVPGPHRIWATATDNSGLRTTVFVDIAVNPPAPVSISGRIVDRDSVGIEGVSLDLRNYPANDTVVASVTTDANGNFTIQNVTTFQNYILRASKENYTFSPQQRIYFNLEASQTNADYTGTIQLQPSDFDGDGESDLAVWRPSTGVWHVTRSIDQEYTANQFGGAQFGDIVVPGNYDGDKYTDQGVFRNGVWYIQNSSNGTVKIVQFGLAGDKPVQGDYDGDGKTDIAVWRESTNVWYVLRSSDGGYSAYQFGSTGDHALTGDYDGDGRFDYAIWRPSTGTWYILQSSNGEAFIAQFGLEGDTPLVGDFDGDKRADISVFRPSTGAWYYLYSSNGSFGYRVWGLADDKPVPGDYDRDGKTDVAVFRESDGNWYLLFSGTGSYAVRRFGSAGDIPVPAAYIR
jgi:hypothetical protein